jgi:hypothetical protein
MGAEELPTLPLSVNGALAMARGAEDGTSSPTQFFVYQVTPVPHNYVPEPLNLNPEP